MRMVYVAKACGLQVMFGCYSDSCLANTAAAQLAPLADYLDLVFGECFAPQHEKRSFARAIATHGGWVEERNQT